LVYAVWAWGVWILLTWTATASQLLFGLGFALIVAAGCAGLGPAAAPWNAGVPRRLAGFALLAVRVPVRIVGANVSLACRVWRPRRPLRSGMVVVPTRSRTDGGLTAVGLLTSVIVDNQVVDLDRHRNELQYHAVWITTDDPDDNYHEVNGPIEDGVRRIER